MLIDRVLAITEPVNELRSQSIEQVCDLTVNIHSKVSGDDN